MIKSLNKYLTSICSRRKADELIKSGKVLVNGSPVLEPYYKVQANDVVTVNGKKISSERKVYIMLNKPKGYITTAFDEKDRKTVLDLIDVKERVFPVGRLDRNTTGVLLLTNDGDLAQKLAHPKYEIEKTYRVELDSKIQKDHILALKKGIELDDGPIAVDSIEAKKKEAIVSLHSGRNRIVRRMFEHFGYTVTRLDRFSYANLICDIPRGEWRYLTDIEVKELS